MEENISPTFKEEIEKTFQSIYNQAVEHCKAVVNNVWASSMDGEFKTEVCAEINCELEKLKK